MENYFTLESLMRVGDEKLRQIFLTRWKEINSRTSSTTEIHWSNDETSGKDLMEHLGPKSCGRIQDKLIRKGDINIWDTSTLHKVLSNLKVGKIKAKKWKSDNIQIQELITVRNKLAHHHSKMLLKEEYNEILEKISKILIHFGETCESIKGYLDKVQGEIRKSNPVIEKMLKLKNEANDLFKSNKYQEAIQRYTKALELENLPNFHLAILYSNRSLTYLKLEEQYKNEKFAHLAQIDGKKASTLRPQWEKAYVRVGDAYFARKKFDKAIIYFDEALSICPENEAVVNSREACQEEISRQRRKDNLDFDLFEKLDPKMMNQLELMGIKGDGLKDMMKKLEGNDLITAHKYRDGIDVEVNYEMAAKYYGKSAAKGEAEGLYNLALLTKQGKGVKRDTKYAISLLEQAARQSNDLSPKKGFFLRNIGVYEAQHSLGLCYHEGIGVEKNPAKAIEYYKKAVENGSFLSANNLGCLYKGGDIGVNSNLVMAEQYFELAAKNGISRGMENLAYSYMSRGELKLAQDWYERSIEHGNTAALEGKSNFYEILKITEKNKKEGNLFDWKKDSKSRIFDIVGSKKLERDSLNPQVSNLPLSSSKNSFIDLTSPYRTKLIITFRQTLKDCLGIKNHPGVKITNTSKPGLIHKSPLSISGLKEITLKEMDPNKDKIYEGTCLNLKIIEDPNTFFTSIKLVIEDSNSEIQLCDIYNFDREKNIHQLLGYGCKITVLNPYMRIAKDGIARIRVDDPKALFLNNENDVDRCRFCGNLDSKFSCVKCKRLYCSRECQTSDWKILKHKLICKT